VKPSDTFDTRDDRVEHRDAQVLYSDSEGVHVMDGATFEQSVLDSSMLGEPAFRLMGPGTSLKLLLYEGRVVSATAPDKVVGKVVETVAGVKSAKAGALKEALIESGAKVMVPQYVQVGEEVEIRTEDGTFVKRVSE